METGKVVEWTTEENYKFKLSAFTQKLQEWLDANPNAILPRRRYMEVQTWLKSGLEDLSISRPKSRLTWGIPIPGDDSHVMYVWMDALTNYLTVTGYPWNNTKDNGTVSQGGWPADAQVIGKDILRFHAVYWPAFLMAADLDVPKTIIAHAHWTQNKMKMSKSIGNVVDPFTAMEEFGTDTIRFYLMNDGGLADDAGKKKRGKYETTAQMQKNEGFVNSIFLLCPSDYASELVTERYRKLLAGQLGNLLSRCTSVNLNSSRQVPAQPSFDEIHPDDKSLHLKLKVLPGLVDAAMTEYRTTGATHAIFDMLSEV